MTPKIANVAGHKIQVGKPTIKSLMQDVRGHTIDDYQLATHVIAHHRFKIGSFTDDLYFYSTNDYKAGYKIGIKPYDYQDETVNPHSVVLRTMFNAISQHEDTETVLSDLDLLSDVIDDFVVNFHRVSGIQLELKDVVDLYLVLEYISITTENLIERDIEKMVFVCECDTLQYYQDCNVTVKDWANLDNYEIIWEALPVHDREHIINDPNNRRFPALRGYAIGLTIEALRKKVNVVLDENSHEIQRLAIYEKNIRLLNLKRAALKKQLGDQADSMDIMQDIKARLDKTYTAIIVVTESIEFNMAVATELSESLDIRVQQQRWLVENHDYHCLKIFGNDNIH